MVQARGQRAVPTLPARRAVAHAPASEGSATEQDGQLSGPQGPALRELKILVVEDDYLQACINAMTLEECGANVLGPVPTVEDAREMIDLVPPDCVVLDLRLRDDFAFLLAEDLRRRGIPTVLATGYDSSVFPFEHGAHENLPKPFTDEQLVAAVLAAVQREYCLQEDD